MTAGTLFAQQAKLRLVHSVRQLFVCKTSNTSFNDIPARRPKLFDIHITELIGVAYRLNWFWLELGTVIAAALQLGSVNPA